MFNARFFVSAACGVALLFSGVSAWGVLVDGAIDITQPPTAAQPIPNAVQPAYQVTYSDGTFNATDWATSALQSLNGAGISVTQQQSLSGGDPGAYFQFTGSLSTFGGSTSYLRNAHFSSNGVFDPAQRGAITGISGGFSQGSFTYNDGVVFETGLILRQNGQVYWPNVNWAYGLQGATGWYGNSNLYTTSSTSLASQWSLVGGSAHPDFSAQGAPIQFGFWTGYYFYSSGGTLVDGVDNWTVNVTSTLPEPSSALLLGIFCATLCVRGRKRAAR